MVLITSSLASPFAYTEIPKPAELIPVEIVSSIIDQIQFWNDVKDTQRKYISVMQELSTKYLECVSYMEDGSIWNIRWYFFRDNVHMNVKVSRARVRRQDVPIIPSTPTQQQKSVNETSYSSSNCISAN